MIDFNQESLFKLYAANYDTFDDLINPILVDGEEVEQVYQALRDGLVITNKRLIAINVQGLSGTKVDMTSIPFSKICMYSIETKGTLDFDAELDIWVSTVGKVRFCFSSNSCMHDAGKIICNHLL